MNNYHAVRGGAELGSVKCYLPFKVQLEIKGFIKNLNMIIVTDNNYKIFSMLIILIYLEKIER